MVTGNHTVSPNDAPKSVTAKPRAKKRKAREAFGQLKTLPSGRLHASYMGPDGKRHNAPQTYDNKTDARVWLSAQQVAIHQGTWDGGDVTLAENGKKGRGINLNDYARKWLETRVNRHGEHLRPRTRMEYERLLVGPLAALGEMRLNSITPEVVRSWNSDQLSTGKKTQTARAYGFLNAVMSTAVEDGLKTSNPCIIRGAQNATTGRLVIPPTDDQLDIIVEKVAPKYKAMVLMAAWGALRFGELTELRRKDIRLLMDSNDALDLIQVNVERAVSQIPGQGFIVGPPKTAAGIRVVTLPPFINDAVMTHLDEFTAPGDDALLFPAAGGGHMNQSTLAKSWYPARKAAGRDDLAFHALHHYEGTKFAQMTGATQKEVQDRLGHATNQAAMRYQHSTGREAELARRMAGMK